MATLIAPESAIDDWDFRGCNTQYCQSRFTFDPPVMSLSSDSVRVDGPAKLSARPTGDQFRSPSDLSPDEAVGGLRQSSGILAHGVARDPQLACGLAQGEALDLGMLTRSVVVGRC